MAESRWILYYHPVSPACQCVLITINYLKLNHEVDLQQIDLFRNEQRCDWFCQLTPLHQVPVLVDKKATPKFVLTESRAIMTYLYSEAGNAVSQSLYPTENKSRSDVDRWLLFDVSTLWHRLKCYHLPVIERKQKDFDRTKLPVIAEALGIIEKALQVSGNFLCGDCLTLADLSVITTLYQAKALKINMDTFTAIHHWCERVSSLVDKLESIVEGSYTYAKLLESTGAHL